MSQGKNIEIRIAATGGDQAASEISKSSDAVDTLNENVKNIERVQTAQAVASLAEGVGKLGQQFRDAAEEVEEFDKDAADALRNTARHLEDIGSKVSTVAAGFAAGGPLGAALASLGVFIQAVTTKFKENEIQALKSAAAEKAAMEESAQASRDAAAAAEERKTAFENAEILAGLEAELAKSKEITRELQRQTALAREKRDLENELLTARDRTDLENIGLEEASGKITPEQAAEKRDAIESGARRRERDERKRRALEDASNAEEAAAAKTTAAGKARAGANELGGQLTAADKSATDLAAYVGGEIKKMAPDSQTGELSDSDKNFARQMESELESAKNLVAELAVAVKKAESAAATAENEAAEARGQAGDKFTRAKDTIRTVDKIQAEDDSRIGIRSKTRSVRSGQRRAVEDRARKDREDDERRQNDKEAGQIGREAENLLPKNVTSEFRAAVQKASAALQDGGTSKELSELARLMSSLGESTNSAVGDIRSQVAGVRAHIETINRRLRNAGM